MFWPDLASIHYCKLAMEWYKKNNVKFVPKTENPPNCPELRVIEKYWAIIKRKMKKTKKLCRNIKDIKIFLVIFLLSHSFRVHAYTIKNILEVKFCCYFMMCSLYSELCPDIGHRGIKFRSHERPISIHE